MTKSTSIFNSTGQGILRILPFEIGDYLVSTVPHIVTWYDCHGSVAKYVSLIHETELAKENITTVLREFLNSGNPLDLTLVSSELSSFCKIFPAGELGIRTYTSSDYSQPLTQGQYRKFEEWAIATPKKILKTNEQGEEKRYLDYFNLSLTDNDWVAGDIVDHTTVNFYDGYAAHFIFTQTTDSLNPDTIAQYESEIQQGKRPFCVIYNSEIIDNDNHYVIDGHHKLMAYHNLKIRPNILEITQITEVNTNPGTDVNRLSDDLFDALYTWQLKHIFDNGIAGNLALQKVLDTPANRFNQFVKQGYVEEYWINGNVKSRGNYQDNKPDGKIETFFENGNNQSQVLYEKGKEIRLIKSWDMTGELHTECVPNDDYLNGEQLSYYRDGKISGRTIYKNGVVADGKSAIMYDEDGHITYVGEHENGRNIRSQWFDKAGNVTEQHGY